MADSSVVSYIKENRKAGFSDADISFELKKSGWSALEVEEAFKEAADSGKIVNPPAASHRLRTTFIVSAIVLLALAAGAYGARNYYEMPARAFSEIPQAMSTVENFSYKASIHAKSGSSFSAGGISANEGTALMDIDVSGVFEAKDNSAFNFSARVESAEVRGDVRFIEKLFYFRIAELSALFPDESPFDRNAWYSLREETFSELGLDPKEGKTIVEKTEEYRKKTAEIASRYGFFTVIEAERAELSDGSPVYKYSVKPKREDFKNYFVEISKLEGADGGIFSDDFFLNDLLNGLEGSDITVSIERSTSLVREVGISIPSLKFEGRDYSFDIVLEFSGYNSSRVQVPSPVIEYDETLRAELEKTRVDARDARRVADIAILRIYIELYYDLEGKYPNSLALIPGDIGEIPKDPATGANYRYFKTANGYHLGANLENMDHPSLKNDSDTRAGFDGGDGLGCSGEANLHCYDVIQ